MTRELPSVPTPPSLGRGGGLSERVENVLRRAAARVFNAVSLPLKELLAGAQELVLETMGDRLLPMTSRLRQRVLDNPHIPSYTKDIFREMHNPAPAVVIPLLAAVALGLVGAVVAAFMGPVSRLVQYEVEHTTHTARADPVSAMQMLWRVGDGSDVLGGLADLGWTSAQVDAWAAIARPRPAVGDLIRLWRLESLSGAVLDSELSSRGYTQPDIAALKLATELVPGPGDLISMGVREAWDEGVAARFGYDENFPAQFGEWMRKTGDVENWAQKYWRAHWQLPGLGVMLGALHRLPDVGMDDLDLYLRVADYAPAFRDYVKRTAYMPYTRVDTRRMYRFGVLTAEQVRESYLAQGYDAEHAENLTRFTIADATEEDREATKTDILSGYNAGVISRADSQAWLEGIGYGPDLAGYFLVREDAKRAQKLKKSQIATVQKLYVGGSISAAVARTRLTGFGVAGAEIDILLDEWQIAREEKIRRPPVGKLDSFLLEDIIPEGQYRQELAALGFQDRYIGWYTSGLLAQKTAKARVEEERARTEQERIRERRVKSDYQIAKAQIDVDIAELRTAIAETQEAMGARLARYERDLALARRVVSEADLRSTAAIAMTEQDVAMRDADVAIARLRADIATNEVRIAALRQELAEAQVGVAPDVDVLRLQIAGLEDEGNLFREARDTLQTEIRDVEVALASEQRAAGDALEEIAGEYEALRVRVVGLGSEANTVREERDADQTTIREIELAVEVAKAQADEAAAAAWTEEEAAVVEGALEVYMAEADVEIAALRVSIEEREDRLAAIRTEVFGLQEDIRLEYVQVEALTTPVEEALASQEATARVALAELRAEVERRDDDLARIRTDVGRLQDQIRVLGVGAEGITLQVREYDRQVRVGREGIAALQVSIAEHEQNAMIIQSGLVSDLAALAVTRSVAEVEAEYLGDRADQEARLAELRSNVAMLREAKATLVVGYREALAA